MLSWHTSSLCICGSLSFSLHFIGKKLLVRAARHWSNFFAVSMKPSLVQYAVNHAGSDDQLCFGDLHPNLTLPGFVRYVAEYGVFVEVPNGLVGLCPKSVR